MDNQDSGGGGIAPKKFDKNSIGNTLFIAGAVCLVCSFMVSTAAVLLKPIQDANVLNDRKANILMATGDFTKEELNPEKMAEVFEEQIKDRIIDLETGEDVTEEYWDGATSEDAKREAVAAYDQFKASKIKTDDSKSFSLKKAEIDDIAKIKRLERRAHVYIYTSKKTGETKYIFPIRGYGLWSTLQGFFALESDMRSIAGLTYYEHKETPGLGGEVDNPNWKAQWTQGKLLTDESGAIKISVTTPEQREQYKVDALSGATITSKGVENMIHFWMGENGFGKFLELEKANSGSASNVESNEGDSNNG